MASATLNIGQAASRSGVSAKMIRHYETLGLMNKPRRTVGNYRVYDEADVHRLVFIRHARDFGFDSARIGELLGLWDNTRRSRASVKRLALEHVAELDRRLADLNTLRSTLKTLVHRCDGGDRPECPIIEGLACGVHGIGHHRDAVPRRTPRAVVNVSRARARASR